MKLLTYLNFIKHSEIKHKIISRSVVKRALQLHI